MIVNYTFKVSDWHLIPHINGLDNVIEKVMEYYDANKEQILEKRKDYYSDNKDQILKERSEYYKDNLFYKIDELKYSRIKFQIFYFLKFF